MSFLFRSKGEGKKKHATKKAAAEPSAKKQQTEEENTKDTKETSDTKETEVEVKAPTEGLIQRSQYAKVSKPNAKKLVDLPLKL